MKKENNEKAVQADDEDVKKVEALTDDIKKQLDESGYDYVLVVANRSKDLEDRIGAALLKGNVEVLAEMVSSLAAQGEKSFQAFIMQLITHVARYIDDMKRQYFEKNNNTSYS